MSFKGSYKGRREKHKKHSQADILSSKASYHGKRRHEKKSLKKKRLNEEAHDNPENLTSGATSVQYHLSSNRKNSPFQEARPKAQALAGRLALNLNDMTANDERETNSN